MSKADKRTALVTAIGSFSADIVIKTLKEMGYRVIGCDIYPGEWVVDSENVDAFYRVSRVSDQEAYAADIQQIIRREDVGLLLPLTDVEVDYYNRARSLDWLDGVTVCLSPAATIDICRDKAKTFRFLQGSKSGIRPIPTRLLSDYDEPPTEYPLVCKPLDGRSSQGLRRVESVSEWEPLGKLPGRDRYIVQPLVSGPVVTVDVVRAPGAAVVAVPRVELLRTLNGAGTSVQVIHDDALVKQCAVLAEELGLVGCANFEFIHAEDGEYYFLECNARFSGGVEFTCMAAYDCVTNHIKAFVGEPIDSLSPYDDLYIARKYEEHVMKERR